MLFAGYFSERIEDKEAPVFLAKFLRCSAGLADLKPDTLAVMHGSSYIGRSEKLLTGLAGVIQETFNNGQ